jgi:nicotinamidase-related amidase
MNVRYYHAPRDEHRSVADSEAAGMDYDAQYDDQTRATYARASYGNRLELGSRPAVLVIDFSLGFTDPESPLGVDMTAAVESCRRVLDAARAKGVPIIHTTTGYEPGGADAGLFAQKAPTVPEVLQLGSPWVELDERLGVRDDEPVVLKKFPSGLFGTPVASLLISHRTDTVILCGAVTSGCVRATAVDLFSYGYPTLVPRDAVADRAQGPHDANLFDMHAKCADVVSSDEVIEYLAGVPSRLEAGIGAG